MNTITAALSKLVDPIKVGHEIYLTATKAMDAAEKEKQTGGEKKAWVLAFLKSFVTDLGENWERWAKVLITFIDFAKSVFNQNKK